jgi:hypothetical protein
VEDKIIVFDVVDIQPGGVARPTRARGESGAATRAVEASTGVIEQSLTGFIATVKSMLDKVDDSGGNFHVDTVEVAAEVSTEGKVGFMGVGLAASASSSMKILFARKP